MGVFPSRFDFHEAPMNSQPPYRTYIETGDANGKLLFCV